MTTEITVLFNNVAHDSRLTTAHGFACLIEGPEGSILFDSGCDGHILLANMKALGKDPEPVERVVISHMHWDHMGGLWDFLRKSGPVELFLPKSFSKDFVKHAEMLGARVVSVDGPAELAPGVHSTGEMGDKIKEQGLVLGGDAGSIVITGCAHPGIVAIVERAQAVVPGPVGTILGGFHMRADKEKDVHWIVGRLEGMNVRRVGSSHCTGDGPVERFREVWQDDFLDFGCGATLRLDPGETTP